MRNIIVKFGYQLRKNKKQITNGQELNIWYTV